MQNLPLNACDVRDGAELGEYVQWHAMTDHACGAVAEGGDAQQGAAVAIAQAFASGDHGQATAVAIAISVAINTYGCDRVQPTIASEYLMACRGIVHWLRTLEGGQLPPSKRYFA